MVAVTMAEGGGDGGCCGCECGCGGARSVGLDDTACCGHRGLEWTGLAQAKRGIGWVGPAATRGWKGMVWRPLETAVGWPGCSRAP